MPRRDGYDGLYPGKLFKWFRRTVSKGDAKALTDRLPRGVRKQTYWHYDGFRYLKAQLCQMPLSNSSCRDGIVLSMELREPNSDGVSKLELRDEGGTLLREHNPYAWAMLCGAVCPVQSFSPVKLYYYSLLHAVDAFERAMAIVVRLRTKKCACCPAYISWTPCAMCPECATKNEMAHKIQRAWRKCVSDPAYLVCRKRLMREFAEL
jgi:hypothetical protein